MPNEVPPIIPGLAEEYAFVVRKQLPNGQQADFSYKSVSYIDAFGILHNLNLISFPPTDDGFLCQGAHDLFLCGLCQRVITSFSIGWCQITGRLLCTMCLTAITLNGQHIVAGRDVIEELSMSPWKKLIRRLVRFITRETLHEQLAQQPPAIHPH